MPLDPFRNPYAVKASVVASAGRTAEYSSVGVVQPSHETGAILHPHPQVQKHHVAERPRGLAGEHSWYCAIRTRSVAILLTRPNTPLRSPAGFGTAWT